MRPMFGQRVLTVGAVLLCVSSSGCRGPSGSPQGSVKAFYSAAGAQDWESMANLLSDASLTKLGTTARAQAYFAAQFTGWKNFSVDIDDYTIDADGKNATVRFTCRAEVLERYKVITADCSDVFSLVKQSDGWHIHLPGAQRIKPL
ncbi:MAG: nuclear transport factor 2 family protein [Myxococcota bacterium]